MVTTRDPTAVVSVPVLTRTPRLQSFLFSESIFYNAFKLSEGGPKVARYFGDILG